MSYFIDDVMQKIYFRCRRKRYHRLRSTLSVLLALADMLKDDFGCTFFARHPTFTHIR
ncbi:MAG: hypothetical protein ACLUVY_08970 [Bacteroides uniformis]